MTQLISIIIPVYNVEQYLRQCLNSVINQTYKNLEIILVDDGSTDNSGKICDEYALKDNRIEVIHKQNGGLSSARNAGLDIAKGDYVGFIDSDDFVDLDMYNFLINLSLKYNSDITSSAFYMVDKDKLYHKKILNQKQVFSEISKTKAIEMGFSNLGFYACNKIFKRNLFDKIRFPIGRLYEDIFTISKTYIKSNKIVVYDKPLYYYNRTNLTSITKRPFNTKKFDYFKATKTLLVYAKKQNNNSLIKFVKTEMTCQIVVFFRQMIDNNFGNKDIIDIYIKILRKNIFLCVFSKHKIQNKLFAIVACINFNLAKDIYKILKKIVE